MVLKFLVKMQMSSLDLKKKTKYTECVIKNKNKNLDGPSNDSPCITILTFFIHISENTYYNVLGF